MRFNKCPQFEFKDTNQKRAAYRRKIRKQKEKYPLLDLVGELDFLSEDEEMERREFEHYRFDLEDRNRRAKEWREARSTLRQHPEHKLIYQKWQNCNWTALPHYLKDMIGNWERYQKEWKRYEDFKKQLLLKNSTKKIKLEQEEA